MLTAAVLKCDLSQFVYVQMSKLFGVFVGKEEEVGANPLADNRGAGDKAKPSRGVARRSTFREFTALFTTESVGLWVALCCTAWWRRGRSGS